MLCERLGKRLIVESELGVGTTFTFSVRTNKPSKTQPKRSLLCMEQFRSFRESSVSHCLRRPAMKVEKRRPPIREPDAGRPGRLTEINSDDAEGEAEEDAEAENTSEFIGQAHINRVRTASPKKLLSEKAPRIRNTLRSLVTSLSGEADLLTSPIPSQSIRRRTKALPSVQQKPRLIQKDGGAHSPRARRSPVLRALSSVGSKSGGLTTVSFLPGNDLSENKDFLQEHVSRSSKRGEKPATTRVYHQAMAHINNPCGCPTILVVDDTEICKMALTGMLRRLGLICIEASNGEEAITEIRKVNGRKKCYCGGIRLVLMDYDMPVMTGVEASERISELVKHGEISRTTIVAVTAYEGATIEKKCKDAGMAEVVPKPIQLDSLMDCLTRHLTH